MTEQYYLRARYYNPTIARFTQEDVYRGDGLNLYAFCRNNAVLYVDPSGYSSVFPSNIYVPGTNVDIYVDPGRVNYDKSITKRNAEGIVTGNFSSSISVSGSIMSADKTTVAIPQDVAQQLIGRKYNNFNDFRSDFWKAMGNSPSIRGVFDESNIWAMQQGFAPRVRDKNLFSKQFRKQYNIDHVREIQDGGYVYDLDNLSIVAPKTHEEKTRKENENRKCKI